jgi:hypothetical protein
MPSDLPGGNENKQKKKKISVPIPDWEAYLKILSNS